MALEGFNWLMFFLALIGVWLGWLVTISAVRRGVRKGLSDFYGRPTAAQAAAIESEDALYRAQQERKAAKKAAKASKRGAPNPPLQTDWYPDRR